LRKGEMKMERALPLRDPDIGEKELMQMLGTVSVDV